VAALTRYNVRDRSRHRDEPAGCDGKIGHRVLPELGSKGNVGEAGGRAGVSDLLADRETRRLVQCAVIRDT